MKQKKNCLMEILKKISLFNYKNYKYNYLKINKIGISLNINKFKYNCI